MKIGDNLKEIRESEKNFKLSYVAKQLNISTRAYLNIESNIADITITRLAQLAEIFECSPTYILEYKNFKKEFQKSFHDSLNRQGYNPNKIYQEQNMKNTVKLYEELLESERKQIILLEALIKKNKTQVKSRGKMTKNNT